jgi:hypothetical protein
VRSKPLARGRNTGFGTDAEGLAGLLAGMLGFGLPEWRKPTERRDNPGTTIQGRAADRRSSHRAAPKEGRRGARSPLPPHKTGRATRGPREQVRTVRFLQPRQSRLTFVVMSASSRTRMVSPHLERHRPCGARVPRIGIEDASVVVR